MPMEVNLKSPLPDETNIDQGGVLRRLPWSCLKLGLFGILLGTLLGKSRIFRNQDILRKNFLHLTYPTSLEGWRGK